MAPIGAKLGQNVFQTIPNVSFFDTEKKVLDDFFPKKIGTRFFFQETGVSDEPGIFERHWQIRRQKILPEVGLFLGRLPWRKGKRLNLSRKPGPGTENDFNHLVLGLKILASIFFSRNWRFG